MAKTAWHEEVTPMGLAVKRDAQFWALALSPEEKESVSTSISQTWTDQAIKCYLTKAECENCSIPRGHYSFTCQMNKVVPVLLENLGEPDPLRVEKILPFLYD